MNCGRVTSRELVEMPVAAMGSRDPTRTTAPFAKFVPVMCIVLGASLTIAVGLTVVMVGAFAGGCTCTKPTLMASRFGRALPDANCLRIALGEDVRSN